jgi:hypothetical protein
MKHCGTCYCPPPSNYCSNCDKNHNNPNNWQACYLWLKEENRIDRAKIVDLEIQKFNLSQIVTRTKQILNSSFDER